MKKQSYLFQIVFVAALRWTIVSTITGCTSARPAQNGSYRYLYDYESNVLHPDFTVYHSADDSSTLFFRIRADNLLYTRLNSGVPFEAHLRIHYDIFNPGANQALVDSSTFLITDYSRNDMNIQLIGKHRFRLGQGDYTMRITLTDLKREISCDTYLVTDKTSKISEHNFMLSRQSDFTEPLFGNFCSTGETLYVKSDRLSLSASTQDRPVNLKFLQFKTEIKLPPPPFSSSSPELPEMEDGINVGLRRDSLNNWYVLPLSGFYFLTSDAEEKQGYPLYLSSKGYPEVQNFDQLVGPLRYITSKTEYEQIATKPFPKTYIDNFWIECGGSKDHARELIKTYYGRVREANAYFSTYTEGWRTDRGMIHLIFGNPNKINKTGNSETWIYGDEGSAASLSMTFHKIAHPLSDNVYQLVRDPMMKQYWEQMVTAWRQGRIFTD